jgi:hypothetical protein
VTRIASALLLAAAAAVLAQGPALLDAAQSVRVVDSVAPGSAGDEAAHHFAGAGTATGTSGGRLWRDAAGWFSYSLRIYDDSPLAVVFILAGTDAGREAFDVFVDGKKAAVVTRGPGHGDNGEVSVKVPFERTEGRTSVEVKLVAHEQARTSRVFEIRTVQEHLEYPRDLPQGSPGTPRTQDKAGRFAARTSASAASKPSVEDSRLCPL